MKSDKIKLKDELERAGKDKERSEKEERKAKEAAEVGEEAVKELEKRERVLNKRVQQRRAEQKIRGEMVAGKQSDLDEIERKRVESEGRLQKKRELEERARAAKRRKREEEEEGKRLEGVARNKEGEIQALESKVYDLDEKAKLAEKEGEEAKAKDEEEERLHERWMQEAKEEVDKCAGEEGRLNGELGEERRKQQEASSALESRLEELRVGKGKTIDARKRQEDASKSLRSFERGVQEAEASLKELEKNLGEIAGETETVGKRLEEMSGDAVGIERDIEENERVRREVEDKASALRLDADRSGADFPAKCTRNWKNVLFSRTAFRGECSFFTGSDAEAGCLIVVGLRISESSAPVPPCRLFFFHWQVGRGCGRYGSALAPARARGQGPG